MILLSVSNLIIYYSIYRTPTLSLACLGPPTHHRPTATCPEERAASRQLVMTVNAAPVFVCVCVCSCVPLILVLPVPGMWRFVWRVSHTLCYQHLCDEHKHSLRGLGWGSVTDGTVSGSPSVVLKALLLSLATRILSPCAAKVPSFLTQGKGRSHLTTAPATHVPSCCCCFFFLSLFSSTLLNYGNRCCFA